MILYVGGRKSTGLGTGFSALSHCDGLYMLDKAELTGSDVCLRRQLVSNHP